MRHLTWKAILCLCLLGLGLGIPGRVMAQATRPVFHSSSSPFSASGLHNEAFQDGLTVAEDTTAPGLDVVVAWLTLVILLATLVYAVQRLWLYREAWWPADPPSKLRTAPNWAVAAAGVVGLGIASYLALVRLTNSALICGPLGGCDAVQESRYALLLGVPLGIWGVLAYGLVLALWGAGSFGQGRAAQWARPGLLGLSFFSVLFSLYLTLLEIFVIRATCTWCISSALAAAVICWLLILDRAWVPLEISRRPRRRRKVRR